MDIETIAAVVFILLLTVLLYFNRKKLDTKFLIPYVIYFSMYKTKWGLNLMDALAKKYQKLSKWVGYFGIVIGFLGMILITYSLISNIYMIFTKPQAMPGVGLVLPVKAKGVFFVPFFYWIISIFIIAIVHEFSHGLIARAHNMKVKSSGFAFLGIVIPIIPAAFVEPDEKELVKRPYRQQLSVFAAGPLANIAAAFAFLLIALFIFAPALNATVEPNGIKFNDYVKGNTTYPAESAGISTEELIQEIDGKPTPYLENMSAILKEKSPGDFVKIKTNASVYTVKLANNPENESAAFLGISYPEQSTRIKDSIKAKYGTFLPNALSWTSGLLIILVLLNFGIGLFNLVPLGPLDGGRMLQLPLQKYFGKEKGKRIWGYVGLFFLVVILINLAAGFGWLKFLM